MAKDIMSEDDDGKTETFILEEKVVKDTITVKEGGSASSQPKDDDSSGSEDSRVDIETQSDDHDAADQPSDTDEKRKQRREERKQRRERRAQAREFNRELVEEQAGLIRDLSSKLANHENRFVQGDVQSAVQKRDAAVAKVRELDTHIANAISVNDGTTAMRLIAERDSAMHIARTIHDRLEKFQQTVKQGRDAPKPSDQPKPISPDVQTQALKWMRKNSWFDPKLKNEDSRVVQAIESAVADEGLDPSTPEYWEEVDERAQKYLPHRYKSGKIPDDSKDDDDDADDDRQPRPARKGPPAASSSRDASDGATRTVEVRISPARKQAMIEAGIWEDPARRARMLLKYASYDQANKATR